MGKPIAHLLEPRSLESIRRAMLQAEPHLPSATEYCRDYPDPWTTPGSLAAYDSSFSRQIKALTASGAGDTAFFLTARSALPLVHTLMGYFRELEAPEPLIFSLQADRTLAAMHHLNRSDPYVPTAEFGGEVGRLRRLVEQHRFSRACIVEQMVVSGKVALYGHALLRAAGIKPHNIHTMCGRWYLEGGIYTRGDDQGYLNSQLAHREGIVANHLYETGVLAAQTQVSEMGERFTNIEICS